MNELHTISLLSINISISEINEELKKMLIDRDDLYMQQDSLLVDVEDLTR